VQRSDRSAAGVLPRLHDAAEQIYGGRLIRGDSLLRRHARRHHEHPAVRHAAEKRSHPAANRIDGTVSPGDCRRGSGECSPRPPRCARLPPTRICCAEWEARIPPAPSGCTPLWAVSRHTAPAVSCRTPAVPSAWRTAQGR